MTEQKLLDKANQLREDILVYSYLYYKEFASPIPDSTWDTWARQLRQLHIDNPDLANEGKWANQFQDWAESGCTGHHLKLDTELMVKAKSIIND